MTRNSLFIFVLAPMVFVIIVGTLLLVQRARVDLILHCVTEVKRTHQFDSMLSEKTPVGVAFCACLSDGTDFSDAEITTLFNTGNGSVELNTRNTACRQWLGNMGKTLPIANPPLSEEGKRQVEVCMESIDKAQSGDNKLFAFGNYKHLSLNMCNCVADENLFSADEFDAIYEVEEGAETKRKMQDQVIKCFSEYGGLRRAGDAVYPYPGATKE